MKQQNTYNPLYNGNVMAMYKREFEIDCSGSDECDNFTLIEQPIYGSSRLGLNKETTLHSSTFSWSGGTPLSYYSNRGGGNVNMVTVPGYADEKTGSEPWDYSRTLSNKAYECANHLGNVLATVSDRTLVVDDDDNDEVDYYLPDVLAVQDYYPFGMQKPGYGNPYNDDYRFGYNGMEDDGEVKGQWNSYTTEFRLLDPRLGKWLSVDMLSNDYPWQSPYVSMDNKPITLIDPFGLSTDWVQSKDGKVYWDDNATSKETTKADETYLSADKLDRSVVDAIGSDIMNSNDKMNTFTNYVDNSRLGENYFIDAANANFDARASGPMASFLDNTKGAPDGILISMMTRAWKESAGLGADASVNKTEHYIGMFLLGDKYGESVALTVGTANEIRGLWTDLWAGNMKEALQGLPARNGGATAFEWSDLNNNQEGVRYWLKYRGVKSMYNPKDNPGFSFPGYKF